MMNMLQPYKWVSDELKIKDIVIKAVDYKAKKKYAVAAV